jgi:hypothetical protein
MDEWEDDARAEWRAEVLQQCEDEWYEMNKKAGATLDRLRERASWQYRGKLCGFLYRLKNKLETDIDTFTDEQFDEVAESLADAAHEARDPYGYRGLSRKDFI